MVENVGNLTGRTQDFMDKHHLQHYPLTSTCHPAQSNYKKLKKFIPDEYQERKRYYLVEYLPVPSSLSFWIPNITNSSSLKENVFHRKKATWSF